MFNFFADKACRSGDYYHIGGADFNHIKNVLRLQKGDELLVSDGLFSHLCCIEDFENETAIVKIVRENHLNTELPVKIHLFQGLPKADKMELIIQKTVELGVFEITPVEMNRCVVKLDQKKKSSKQSRWQSISESAAKQSKRTIIPEISEVLSYKQMLEKAKTLDLFLVPYENERGMKATKDALRLIKGGMTVGILIGPEGGFEEREIEQALAIGGKTVSLGSRILRTETAAIACVTMCMLECELNIDGENK